MSSEIDLERLTNSTLNLMQYCQLLNGRIEALTAVVNTLALIACSDSPEKGKIVEELMLQVADQHEKASDELDEELSVNAFHQQVARTIPYLRV